eukprot:10194352-Heterocapsa_arctica.AAC.1
MTNQGPGTPLRGPLYWSTTLPWPPPAAVLRSSSPWSWSWCLDGWAWYHAGAFPAAHPLLGRPAPTLFRHIDQPGA